MRQDTILEENTIAWVVLHRMKTTGAIKCISGAFQLLKKPVLSNKEKAAKILLLTITLT